VAFCGLLLGASFGCAALLDVGGYTIADGGVAGCDEAGTTLNACTDASCVGFDNGERVKSLLADGGLPGLPPPADAGIPDMGGIDTALPEGGPPLCSTVNPGRPVVYVSGTAKPYVAALARVLYSAASGALTVLYQGNSSCVAWDSILNGTPITGTASYWNPGSATVDN